MVNSQRLADGILPYRAAIPITNNNISSQYVGLLGSVEILECVSAFASVLNALSTLIALYALATSEVAYCNDSEMCAITMGMHVCYHIT